MTNYGGISEEYTQLGSSPIVVVPVPYDGTSTWVKGADAGPDAILEASANMELYDIETDSEVFKRGIHTAEPVTENSSPEAMTAAVYRCVKQFVNMKKMVVTLGGEHSVSVGAVQAYAEKYPDLTVIQFDAHTDLRPEYEHSKYNHACAMARIREFCPIVQIGIRSMDVVEKPYIDRNRVFFADQVRRNDNWMKDALALLTPNVYITFDLDVFDPAFLPSTGTPEPGGMNWYQVIDFLREINRQTNIVGFDVVELCPNETDKASDFFATKLIYQLLSFKFETK